jgi:hypothetical protein
MGEINVNFADVKTRSVVPAGDYPGVIADCVLRQKAGSEHPYLNWDVVITEGDHEGRHVFMTSTFKPEGLFNMMNAFRNLGYQEQEYNVQFNDETGQVTEPEVIGLACVARVYNEPYQGRQTAKVSDILGPNGENAQDAAEPTPAPATPATRPATRATAPAAAAKTNGPAPAARRSPFPAAPAGAAGARREFKK